MKTIFILAGFDLHETALSTDYAKLREELAGKGYNVVPVDISWYRKTPSQYVEEFRHFYAKHKTGENMVIGNSFGAVIAFLAAAELRPDVVCLCSLSPFFKEDRRKKQDAYGIRYFGKRRMEDLWQYSADEVAKQLNDTKVKTFVLYGEKEHRTSPDLVARCKDTASKLRRSKLLEIAGAPHDMADSAYTSAIVDLF
ncbi:MAG TPA: alpha/beta hydrolase [Verrucomicrobiae bacterium]|jgi:pimeloyl-ACP methyl ester carboxylesterase|nr:alpha/beta hydrolase [Verrucomicrobiae bacterium]